MKDTLEQLAAEVTAANDDLNLGNHADDLQRLRELESDREDLIERINAREYRLQVARDALLAFMSPEARPEQSAPVAAPESAGGVFNTAFYHTAAPDAWTPEPRDTSWPVPEDDCVEDGQETAGDDVPYPDPMRFATHSTTITQTHPGDTWASGENWAVKPEPDEQPDTEPDHIHRNGAAE
jgi:hypothetical protein